MWLLSHERRGLLLPVFLIQVLLSEKISPAAPCCDLYKGVIRLWILSKSSNTMIKGIMKWSIPPLQSLSDDVLYPRRDFPLLSIPAECEKRRLGGEN